MDHQQPDPRDVVAGLLGDERMRAILRARDIGALFELLNKRGISTRRLAAAANISQGRLYDYVKGKVRVEKLSMFEQLADAFGIPGALLGLAARPWEPVTQPPRAAPTPEVLANTDDLAAMDAFRLADRTSGGGRLYSAVVRHLSDSVAPRLLNGGGPSVFGAAAALTEMAGWMAHDSGQDHLAARHFATALPLAQTSGDTAFAAHVAASSSHLSLQSGDPQHATHWALLGIQLAHGGPHLPSLTARLHSMHARALATLGRLGPAAQALEQASEALAAAADETHPWLSPFDQAALASESALTFADLGRYDDALHHAKRAVRLREHGRTRSLALSKITLAAVYVQRGELEEALHVGVELLSTSPTLGSVRVVHQLDSFRDALEPHAAHGLVRDYLVHFDQARRTRALLLADIMPPREGSGSGDRTITR
ncbi:helix-turn-helix domain-containing protein [Kitasatospora cineracea]|uniref:Cro/C1-type helix-turn-helix DNA-binding protein n=1 Tax=Kitasatospora cineracea TaxID=88074 RepID=A0A3N4RIK2_9ACTN|nr:helix-turn-helix domain-containing protein [Kitasatospora cineracea]RPE33222.1 Cro/C1-type helix-turn-helix DNA-binding protein [Kitasatospora cineracea]